MARKEKLNKITQIANNEEAAVALFNENVDKVNRAIEDSLSISGKDPNVMRTPLDMGEQPIINAKMRNIADRMDGDVVLWGEVKDFGNATNRAETAAKEAEAWKNETKDIAKTLEDKLRDELAANYVKNNTKASGSLAMGEGASTSRADDIIIGKNASDEGSSQGLNVVIGTGAKAFSHSANSVSIGSAASSTLFGTAIGASARASGINAIALGVNSLASGAGSIQIGAGSNSEAESLYVYLGTQTDLNGDGVAEEWVGNNYKLLGKDGKIPAERLPALSYATQADLQKVREDFMDSDNDLQIQLNGQAAVLEEVKDDCMANLSEIADLKTNKQDKLTAGANITIEGNVISATGSSSGGDVDLTGYVKNKSTAGFAIGPDGSYMSSGANSISIGYGDVSSQVSSSGSSAIAIGTYANASGNYGVSIGGSSSATGQFSVGLGYAAKAASQYAIQIGQGTNTTANTLKVGLASNKNYTLLNADGTIPAERLVNAPAPDVPLPITNCITEIPQDIKLELNNGVLTLKSGSVIHYPNGKSSGKNVFASVTTSSDRILTFTTTPSTDTKMLVCCNTSGALSANFIQPLDKCFTADTNPSETPYLVYNTTTNRCNYNGQTAVTFPIAIITQGSDGVTKSIDQVFNGFGYIGSTIFALPGVKGLIPNGRNADGSLKNTEFITDHVSIVTNASNLTVDLWYAIGENGDIANSLTDYWKYDEQKNIWVHDSVSWGANMPFACSYTNGGKVENFVSKTVFHAVGYNDFKKLDDEAVKLTGNQTIAGTMDFTAVNGLKATTSGSNNIVMKNTAIDVSESSRTTAQANALTIYDKNDKVCGMFGTRFNTNGTNQSFLQVRNLSTGSQVSGEIGVSIDENGTVSTSAPTPASSKDNSTQIATTAWVRNHRCTTAATTTSTASVDAPAYIIQNYRNGNSWYRVWSDGWIEQGGLTESADSALTASFPKSFTTTNYTLLISTHTGCRLISEITRTKTNFTGKQYNVSAGTYINENKLYAWYACGY